jgi:hypothetical protein
MSSKSEGDDSDGSEGVDQVAPVTREVRCETPVLLVGHFPHKFASHKADR